MLWICIPNKKQRSLGLGLIEVTANRIGDNTILSRSAWPPPHTTPPLRSICDHPIRGIATPCDTPGDVYKIGARSGTTTGEFSHIKSDVRFSWDKELGLKLSTEYVFLGETQRLFGQPRLPYSSYGDSGSLVLNERGEWVSLVHGGNEKKQVSAAIPFYVTDAQSILDHMSELTNGEVTFEIDTS